MKRFIAAFLSILLFITPFALSESQDSSFMSVEELMSALGLKSDQIRFLGTGEYLVGESIKPGQYYVAMTKPDEIHSSSFFRIYADKATFDKEEPHYHKLALSAQYVFLGDTPKSIILEENNLFVIDEGVIAMKSTPFDESELYVYNPPEGTVVPEGTYVAEEDIPLGKYIAYPADIKGGSYRYLKSIQNEDGTAELKLKDYFALNIHDPLVGRSIIIEEGDVLEVRGNIILQKQAPLKFD